MTKRKAPGLVLANLASHIKVMGEMLNRGGGTARFETPAQAFAFRHSCYRARALLRKANESITPPGQFPASPYDDLFLIVEDRSVIFKLRSMQKMPELSFANEEPDDLDRQLREAAEELKRRI